MIGLMAMLLGLLIANLITGNMETANCLLFDAAIWGTVSDWVMVLITLVSAIFIYSTLKAQLEVTKIESSRHRIERMPVFDAKLVGNSTSENRSGSFRIGARLRIELKTYSEAHNISLILPEDQSHWESLHYYKEKRYAIIKYTGGFEMSLLGTFPPVRDFEHLAQHGTLDFSIRFTDSLKNHYQQDVEYFVFNGQDHISVTYPELVDEP